MKEAYVICEVVDLGYVMLKGYLDYDKAKEECDRLEKEAKEVKLQQLLAMKHFETGEPWYTNVSEAKRVADGFMFYELDSVEIEDAN